MLKVKTPILQIKTSMLQVTTPILKKFKTPIIDPSTGKNIKAFTLFKKIYATICLQRFYRNFIKCHRAEDGQPIDPILKDGFDPVNLVRIIYKSNMGGKIVKRLQCFDITSLWESLGHTKKNKNKNNDNDNDNDNDNGGEGNDNGGEENENENENENE